VAPGCVQVAVVGAHLTGQPLNRELTSRGARLVRTCRTAAGYRLYALQNTTPPKPGLVRDQAFSGPGIEVEIWSVPKTSSAGSWPECRRLWASERLQLKTVLQ
jgi:allophanate hydrolase